MIRYKRILAYWACQQLVFGENRPLVLRPPNYLERRLDPSFFFRANRHQIINLHYIQSVTPWLNGGYKIDLPGDLEITMSRRQAQRFQETRKL